MEYWQNKNLGINKSRDPMGEQTILKAHCSIWKIVPQRQIDVFLVKSPTNKKDICESDCQFYIQVIGMISLLATVMQSLRFH